MSDAAQAREKLVEEIYDDLRRLARRLMSQERPGHTLQATALVHEALLKFLGPGATTGAAADRRELMSIAAVSMRRLLVDHARAKHREKRGGGLEVLPIRTEMDGVGANEEKLLLIHDAMERLAAVGERLARVAELKVFGGYSTEEIAEITGVTTRTVERDWLFAKTWLQKEIQ